MHTQSVRLVRDISNSSNDPAPILVIWPSSRMITRMNKQSMERFERSSWRPHLISDYLVEAWTPSVTIRGCTGLAFSKAHGPGLFEQKARGPGRAHGPSPTLQISQSGVFSFSYI